jgi:hypothetical protein
MPTSTYKALATVTLGSSAATVTFGSIPATYRDLVVVLSGGIVGVSDTNIFVAYNSDTTNANYRAVQMSGTGSATDGAAISSTLARILNYYGYATQDLNTNIIIQILDYSATDKHKTYLSRANNAGNGTAALVGRWGNTSAITTVEISSQAGSIRTGTTISLYGIVS